MSALTSLSVSEMRKGLLSGEYTASDLTEAHLTRIKETNEQLNSFITIAEEEALRDAKKAEQLLSEQGETSPTLTGIPIAIKDMLVTEGIETTCASKMLKGFIPPYECTAVKNLREAGAVILGKTNLDEFAMGSSNENSAFGPVRNPHDQERVSGGSSGGSAVSVASGQAALALGTDTGGSIRQPASLCGVVGMKPTYGRVSRYGAVAYASSCDQIGPFGRSVEDVANILGVISGQDKNDSTSMDIEVPNYVAELAAVQKNGLQGVKVGVPEEYFIDGMKSDVEEKVRKSLEILKNLGAELVDISLPHTKYALPVYYIIAPAEASSNLSRYDGVRYGNRAEQISSLEQLYERTRAEGFGPEVKRRILIGTYVLSAGYYDAYYLKAQRVRTLIIEDFKSAFSEKCDIIATPVSPLTAFRLGERMESSLEMAMADVFTVPVNLAGLPAISLPCGKDEEGLPIGFQFIGPAFAEGMLLRAAQALESEVGFNSREHAA